MKSNIAEARKERETWRQTYADSNLNCSNAPGSTGLLESRGNCEARSEIISDSTKLLKQKLEENPSLDPKEDSVQFIIVTLLASHIEFR